MITRRKFGQTAGAVTAAAILPSLGRAQAQNVLVVAATRTPGGFDGDALRQNTQNVVTQVYEGLTRYATRQHQDGRTRIDASRVEPHLAESWTVAPDGKSYNFKLRQGVRSFFGNELTADDVVWSWRKSIEQNRTGGFIARVSSVTAVEPVSRYEVRFVLSAPNAILPRALTLYTPAIYDATVVKQNATTADPWAIQWIEQNTAGFGPYHLQSMRANQEAIFVANPNYFRGRPFFERVIYREVPSGASRIQLLRTGNVHWVEEMTQRQVVELQRDNRVRVEREPGSGAASARMNPRFPPFDDRRVRQALLYAVDYESLNQSVFEGLGARAKSLVPEVVEGHDDSAFVFERDLAKARQLLAEAGHRGGLNVTLEYSQIFWWEQQLAIQLKSQLAEVGVNVETRLISDADMRARGAMNRRDLPFFTFLDYPIVLDPVYALYLNAHSQGPSNRNGYSNREFDALIDQALVEQDSAKRIDLARRAQRLHIEDATWILTYNPGSFEAMVPNIRGWIWYPDLHERWVDLRVER